MTPVVGAGGYAGWRLLQRTLPQQQAAFRDSPAVRRLADHFRANVARADTADKLVADRRLLEVALGAFGLKDDIGSRAFLRRVLEDGTLKDRALANRLSDKRYHALALEFGYGDLGARTALPGFADRILARYEARAFQEAVGERDGALRLALNLENGLADVVARTANPNAQWFSVMAEGPLREVLQTALGLPRSFGALDIDRQLATYRDRARALLGTDKVAEIAADPARRETLVRLYLLRSEPPAPQGAGILQLLARRG